MNNIELEKIIARGHGLTAELESYRDMILANAVMISEIPAPTFAEEDRIHFFQQRLVEEGLHSISIDELGNGVGILPGKTGKRTVLVTAHADTPFPATHNHSCTLERDRIYGAGIADNSLGLAVLATLPLILNGLGIRLENDLLLLASTASLGHGNQRGLRFFLGNTKRDIAAGISVEGVPLGRLHYRSMASLGGKINCNVNRRVNQKSAIEIMNRIINRLAEIKTDSEQHTGLIFGEISGGASYKVPARNTSLSFQLRSDVDENVALIRSRITAILDDESRESGVSCHLEDIAGTKAGGLDYAHPFVLLTRKIMAGLDIQPRESIYSAVISGFVEHNVPSICLGITEADNVNYADEFVEIEPILTGVAQLIGVVMAIDGGVNA
jgi:acetylornithine deacetylase/succinyl-diaminopimelate desuccinylase-like protein